MKSLLRTFLINLSALWVTSEILPSFDIDGGLKAMIIGTLLFMLIGILVVPLIKVVLLPINLLTLGLFAWIANVIGVYLLTILLPSFKLLPYNYPGLNINGFIVPEIHFNAFQVAIMASLLIGLITNFARWLVHTEH